MALFEDKRKPVNIYAKGTPTANAQNKMTRAVGSVTKPVVDVADNMMGGAGARAIGRGIKKVVSPVIEGRRKQNQLFTSKTT